MAFQYKVKRQKEQSGGFMIEVANFELLKRLSEHLRLSRAELVARALKSYLKAKGEQRGLK